MVPEISGECFTNFEKLVFLRREQLNFQKFYQDA